MFMSFAAINHVQYRLTASGKGARLNFSHRAMGPIPEDVRENVGKGWEYKLKRIDEIAQRLKSEQNGSK